MFVVSNAADTRYIATAGESDLNEKFLSAWLDEDNQPVTEYLAFAKAVLSIPAAHRMVSQYTVLDSERKALIMLRPYQIHAVEAIRNAVNPYTGGGRQSGYIWHTTGSGKTLTSYKQGQWQVRPEPGQREYLRGYPDDEFHQTGPALLPALQTGQGRQGTDCLHP